MEDGYGPTRDEERQKATEDLQEQLIKEHFHLLPNPNEYRKVKDRIKELTDSAYRVAHNITTLTIRSYENEKMPRIDPTQCLYSGLEALALQNEVVRVYDWDEGKLGFESVVGMNFNYGDDELTLEYTLIDDERKYIVDFEVKKKLKSPEEQ